MSLLLISNLPSTMAALFNALSARALLKAIALKLHANILYHKLSKAAPKLNGASNASTS